MTAGVDGERLERDDLLVNLLLVLVAGNETTRNLIGNGAWRCCATRTSSGGCKTTLGC